MSSSTESTKPQCGLKCNLNKLQEFPFFASLPANVMKLFAFLCRNNTLEKGEILFSEGDGSSQCVIIISGSFTLTCKHEKTESNRVAVAGEMLGSLALLSSFPSLFTMKAVEQSQIIIIDKNSLEKVVNEFPEIYPTVIKEVIKNIALWDRHQFTSHEEKPKGGVSLL